MKLCPISGLPIKEKNHWRFEHGQGEHVRILSLIGQDIIHSEEFSSPSALSSNQALTLEHLYQGDFLALIKEEYLNEKPLYLVVNCEHIVDFSYSSKKEITSLIYNWSPDYKLVVLYNINPLARLQHEMFKYIAPQHSPIVHTDTYSDAITTILDFKSGKEQEHIPLEPSAEQELALKKEFLATSARMLWLKMFEQHVSIPAETHVTYPYFKALDIMQRDLKAMELEYEKNKDRIQRDCKSLIVSRTTLLNAQIELNKKNATQFKEEKSALLSRISALELEATRISTATAEKSASLRALCELVEEIDLEPRIKQRISSCCTNITEIGKKTSLMKTELTETDSVFISRLQKKHPSLSQRELRIGLLIKLDYNSRDIARTIGLTTRGIESIRYRLHKKIGLDKHRSLKTYLTDLSTEIL
jgi:DNA-binding CsgD family transcriptional regulator